MGRQKFLSKSQLLGSLVACCIGSSTAMAGDVIVEIAGNNIVCTGSTQDDVVEISEGDNGNLIIDGDDSTTFNGQASLDTGIDLSFVNNITMDMRGGDDSVTIDFSADNPGPEGISGDLSLRLGPGGDDVSLQLGDVGGNVEIVMNGGDDFLLFRSSTIAGDVTYLSGAGSDVAFFGRALFGAEPVDVVGNLTTRCAGGDDETRYLEGTVFGELNHSDGGGSDEMIMENYTVLNGMVYQGGGGSDFADFGGDSDFGGFGGPGGEDDIFANTAALIVDSLDNTVIEGGLTARNGGGNDVFNFGVSGGAVCAGEFDYAGGRGRDTVNAGDFASFQGAISVSMGQGNDTVNYSFSVQFSFPGLINGGAGIDSIQPSAFELQFLGFVVIGFEQ